MESEVDQYSDFQMAMRMDRGELDDYISSRVKQMKKEEMEEFILEVLKSKSTTELKVRVYEKTLFKV